MTDRAGTKVRITDDSASAKISGHQDPQRDSTMFPPFRPGTSSKGRTAFYRQILIGEGMRGL